MGEWVSTREGWLGRWMRIVGDAFFRYGDWKVGNVEVWRFRCEYV